MSEVRRWCGECRKYHVSTRRVLGFPFFECPSVKLPDVRFGPPPPEDHPIGCQCNECLPREDVT